MGFESIIAKIPAGGSRSMLGTVVTEDGVRKVNVGGNVLSATWADPMIVDDGDVVSVRIEGYGIGAKAYVSSRSTNQPRPRTGIVSAVPAGSATISVTANGVTYTAEPVEFVPVVGNKVHLDWGAGSPRAIGKVTTTTAVKPPVSAPAPPPPRKASAGKVTAVPRLSRTYWSGGGWGSYAGDGRKVHQGSWYGATVSGAWFYGTPFRSLQGRTITRVTFRTGARLRIGNYSQNAAFRFYAHTNSSQPSGDTNRVTAPFNWTAKPGQRATTIDLPTSFGSVLVDGGGIAIYGEPYAGMIGTTSSSPDSGTLTLYWED